MLEEQNKHSKNRNSSKNRNGVIVGELLRLLQGLDQKVAFQEDQLKQLQFVYKQINQRESQYLETIRFWENERKQMIFELDAKTDIHNQLQQEIKDYTYLLQKSHTEQQQTKTLTSEIERYLDKLNQMQHDLQISKEKYHQIFTTNIDLKQ